MFDTPITYLELYEVYSTLERANHLNEELYHSSEICLEFYLLHLSYPFLQRETVNIINICQTTLSKVGIYTLVLLISSEMKNIKHSSNSYQYRGRKVYTSYPFLHEIWKIF